MHFAHPHTCARSMQKARKVREYFNGFWFGSLMQSLGAVDVR